jgi:hypothetical protein
MIGKDVIAISYCWLAVSIWRAEMMVMSLKKLGVGTVCSKSVA